jgi:AraC-like DNA-binding protein
MLGKDLDAASAGFRVGYNDASHFNREYKSVFGVPPCAICNVYAKQSLRVHKKISYRIRLLKALWEKWYGAKVSGETWKWI